MIDEQLKAAFARVSLWPSERQQELAEMLAEIELEVSGQPYQPTASELQAIDEGLAGKAANNDEVAAAFAALRHKLR
jgi:hypothetical protein